MNQNPELFNIFLLQGAPIFCSFFWHWLHWNNWVSKLSKSLLWLISSRPNEVKNAASQQKENQDY
jgi:hypothetical protein